MVTKALFVRLEARPSKEADVAKFLSGGLPIVQAEAATIAWFAVRLGPSTYGIFDAFPDDAGRQATNARRAILGIGASPATMHHASPRAG